MPGQLRLSTRALATVVSGAVAGGLTAQAALAPAPPPDAALLTASNEAILASVPVPAAPVGELRRQEAQAADDTARRSAPTAASRSAPARGGFVRPARGVVTSLFGEKRGSTRHPGIDFDGGTGDPVVAAAAGTVSMAGPAPAGYAGYGTIVVLDHGGGVQTLYAHLSKTRVSPGVAVLAGEDIGAIGTTGVVTGSHLHFEVRQGGVPVNPRPWLPGG